MFSADEKTSIQVRHRLVPTTPPTPARYGRAEREYERRDALAYMAARDVGQANRVFWITDNGSFHRGQSSVDRLKRWYPNATSVHAAIHASCPNQMEIYFSILQRKMLTPNDFEDLEQLARAIPDFQAIYEKAAKSFEWKFSREDLSNVLAKCSSIQVQEKMAA